jgi:hypothetical protein
MPSQSQAPPMRIGLAWFDREQWQRLTEVVPDRSELDDTYDQWERSAKETMKNLRRSGQAVEKVPIRIEELLAWCTLRGVAPDGKARSQFASEILQRKYGSKS